jgi:MFS family permease
VQRILLAGIGFGLALIVISLSSNLLVSGVLFVIVGGAAVTYSASVNTSLQLQAPPDMRGRFASMISLLIGGTSPIGALLTGGIASGLGVWAAIMANGIMCCVGMGLAYAYLRRVRGPGAAFDLGMREASPAPVTPPGAPLLAAEQEAALG